MSNQPEAAGQLVKLAGRLKVTAYVSASLAIFSYLGVLTASTKDSSEVFLGLFYLTAFGAVVSSVGAVVGRLLLAARRDEQERMGDSSSVSRQDWYQ